MPDSFGKVSTHPRRICATFRPFVVSSKVAPFDLLIPRKLFVTREPSTCVLSFSSRKFPLRRRELKNLPRKISQRLNNSSLSLSLSLLQKFFIKFSRALYLVGRRRATESSSSYFSSKKKKIRNTGGGILKQIGFKRWDRNFSIISRHIFHKNLRIFAGSRRGKIMANSLALHYPITLRCNINRAFFPMRLFPPFKGRKIG